MPHHHDGDDGLHRLPLLARNAYAIFMQSWSLSVRALSRTQDRREPARTRALLVARTRSGPRLARRTASLHIAIYAYCIARIAHVARTSAVVRPCDDDGWASWSHAKHASCYTHARAAHKYASRAATHEQAMGYGLYINGLCIHGLYIYGHAPVSDRFSHSAAAMPTGSHILP